VWADRASQLGLSLLILPQSECERNYVAEYWSIDMRWVVVAQEMQLDEGLLVRFSFWMSLNWLQLEDFRVAFTYRFDLLCGHVFLQT
jgi:hypothetical protein